LFGGYKWNGSSFQFYGDLWRYAMSAGCPPCENNATNLIEKVHKEDINIFPNPNRGEFTIRSSDLINSVKISDIYGNVILDKIVFDESTVITLLSEGIYFVTVKTKSNLNTIKVYVLK